MFDLLRGLGCSTFAVEASRSSTGKPMFGRNLDFPTLGYLQEFSLVTVYHPVGKRSFASVGFPGCVGVLSGMNDAGLTIAVLEVYESKDSSPKFDHRGTPYALCFRRLLEECATIEEAEKLLRTMARTTWVNLAVCDTTKAAVFEITPQSVEVRGAIQGTCASTNHFRTGALAKNTDCWRYPLLESLQNATERPISLEQLKKALHRVNQDDLTLQTMIFEPVDLRLHLAFGSTPSSALPMQTVELAGLLKRKD